MNNNQPPGNFAELVGFFIGIFELIIPFIFSLTLLVIIWKIIDSWIINADNTSKIDEGKQYVLWGVIVLVIMSSVWGILRLLRSSLFGG